MLRNLMTDLRKKPSSKNDAPAELRGKWRKSTFEPEGVKSQDEIPGTSKQIHLWPQESCGKVMAE